jgi:nucleotide-binding universal stress UspA family protein
MAKFIDNVAAVERIFHPSDFSQGSELAFAHALKFALVAQTELTILHASERQEGDQWRNFPGIRNTLQNWGVLPADSAKDAVTKLGIDVKKILGEDSNPVRAALLYLNQRPTDLIVLATAQQGGRMQWLSKSVAQPISRHAGEMTLFVPNGVKGFVDAETGDISLANILLPIETELNADDAIEAARRIGTALGVKELNLHLLYVGDAADMPRPFLPKQEGWAWKSHNTDGDVVDNILGTASAIGADLIITTTAGHDGFLDMLRGNTTERVLFGAQCPVLAIPMS